MRRQVTNSQTGGGGGGGGAGGVEPAPISRSAEWAAEPFNQMLQAEWHR